MILLIALIPAAVVLFIAVGTQSKFITTVAALIAAALGALTGNPAFMVPDILAVVAAYCAAMLMLGSAPKPKPPPIVDAAPAPKPVNDESDAGAFSTLVIIAALVGGFWYMRSSNQPAPKLASPPAHAQPPVSTTRVDIAPPPASTPLPQVTQRPTKRSTKSPLQRCLEIRSEDMMADCLEKLK